MSLKDNGILNGDTLGNRAESEQWKWHFVIIFSLSLLPGGSRDIEKWLDLNIGQIFYAGNGLDTQREKCDMSIISLKCQAYEK